MKYEAKMKHTKFIPATTFLKPVVVGVIVIPVSLLLWIFGVIRSSYLNSYVDSQDTSPTRWIIATLLPAFLAYRGLQKNSLDLSGAVLGYFFGLILTMNYAFMACLMTFFLSSSLATKYCGYTKEKLKNVFKKRGPRNWVVVFCNGGVAAYLGVLYFIESGPGEHPINFHFHYRQSWISIAILSALACSNGETWASELRTVMTDVEPRLITSWRRVPSTNGGVTLAGLLYSALGGMLIGLAYYLVLLLRLDSYVLETAPSQWHLLLAGLFNGLLGSLIDSFLAATCQCSVMNEGVGVTMENPQPGVKWIGGFPWLNKHSVNILSSFFTALLGTYISESFLF